ncbi:ORC-CDC6 family AAA ATPase [Bosea rubneri]|uniref:ATP-binding protein n=1 Tax=Bosea rubneri TaxID=3075434 RepID=A0ABU3SDY3_9HYPH|nr:hypothetical protein [Bosea sp. ZW T0_25]MDU0342989.1 hypothetical protein [Bosea sp. ZW T0_25]
MNPFHELYVGERISSSEFVSIFSTVLIDQAAPLFQPGNVVLAGVQGSGKSMLFKLLLPEIRQEYAKAGAAFPVPAKMRRFIGAGINLNQSQATQFGLRKDPRDPNLRALLFGDFLNYYVASDLLKSISTIANGEASVADELNVHFDRDRQNALVEFLREDACWNGWLDGLESIELVRKRLADRLVHYRQFMHYNREKLGDDVLSTTTAVGEPIAAVVRALRSADVMPPDVNVYVHVDQYEEIGTISSDVESPDYRSVVNRALNLRDPTVSYRIGTRAYAWHARANIFGTTAKLEQQRDYKFVDLDEKLRRHENATGIFPVFAKDVFARRMRQNGIAELDCPPEDMLGRVLGASLDPTDKAKIYGGKRPERALKLPDDWPDAVKRRLRKITSDDPLSGRLGEAWGRQKGVDQLADLESPWAVRDQQWWRKERVELALAQIASTTQSKPIWSGETEVLELSGGNILVFLSICQIIWDMAVQSNNLSDDTPAFPIDRRWQTVAIHKASEYWVGKILQEFGNSGDRHKLIRYFGQMFSRSLLDDRRMSNPGHNGFSTKDSDLEKFSKVKCILDEAGEFGNLLRDFHTTKERDRAARTKWYLSPIYCPSLRLPHVRTKEPQYVRAVDVESWMIQADILPSDGPQKLQRRAKRAPLLDLMDDNG